MKTRSIRHLRADKLRSLQPQQTNTQKMVAAGWLVTITNPLVNDYEGVKYPQEGYAQTATRILETQVADSAAYYGVKPVKTELKRGDLTVFVKEIYEKLVPTATAETPYADRYPVIGGEWVPAAPESAVYGLPGTACPVRPTRTIPCSCRTACCPARSKSTATATTAWGGSPAAAAQACPSITSAA